MSESDIRLEVRRLRETSAEGGGLHEYLISYFYNDIAEQEDEDEGDDTFEDLADQFQSDIQELKTFRVRSDYKDESVSRTDGARAHDLAVDVVKSLKKVYIDNSIIVR